MQVVLTCRNRCSHTNTPRWDFSKTLNSSFPQFSMILLLQPCTVLCFRAQSLLSCSCCQTNFFWIRLVTQSFFSMAQYNKEKNIRLIKRFLLKLGSFEEAYSIGTTDLTERPLQVIQVIVVWRWVIKAFWTGSGKPYPLP